jgi:LmbE family N-acetylglucosaminyl deacetylase
VISTQAIERIKAANRCVILSPHLDDAILSCGGLAAEVADTVNVEIWTFFSAAPFIGPYSSLARWFHDISGGYSSARLAWLRRREDRRACRVVGARPNHFHWHDAVYRKTKNGEPMYGGLRQSHWHAHDDRMVREISALMESRVSRSDVLLTPLGVGKHVDHLILRAAVERLGHNNVLYYVDLPYMATYPDEIEIQAAGMSCHSYDISTSSLQAWIDSIMCYTTQLKMLESAVGSLPSLVRHVASTGTLCLYG